MRHWNVSGGLWDARMVKRVTGFSLFLPFGATWETLGIILDASGSRGGPKKVYFTENQHKRQKNEV